MRNKVIEELRQVQDRVNHDARADVALEYCIKMIVTNQLNEQDFELSKDDVAGSSEEEQSESSENHPVDERKAHLKAWYNTFRQQNNRGFKHNSELFSKEVKEVKEMAS